MKNIRSILHILLGVTLICSCNEATELAHITPNVSLIKYKDIVKIDSLYTYPGDSLYQNWINQYNKNLEDKTNMSIDIISMTKYNNIINIDSSVSVSAILSCRPFFILIFLPCIKMNHYGFSRKSIWKNLETFP